MQYELVIDDDVGQTTVVPLVWDEVRIGRQKGNTIRLTERNVSRSHARLRREGGALRIEDLASYTGVRVNGQRIEGDRPLQVGDRVQIGDYRLSLRLAREATLAREVAEPPKTKEAKGEGATETKAAGGETTRLSLAAPAPEPTAVVAHPRGTATSVTAPAPAQRTTTPTAVAAPTPTLMTAPVVAPPVRVLPTPPARSRRRSAVLVSAALATLALAGGVALWDPAERAPAVESPAEPTPPQAAGSGATLVKREPEPPTAPPTAPPVAPTAAGARPRRALEPTGRAAPLAHPRGARPPAQPAPSEPPPPQESALSPEEAEALLAQTQVHYVNGEFAQAIKLAQKLTRSQGGVVSARAYRLLGAAACNQGALELVNSAYRRLDVQSRQYVMYVCQQAGVSFNGVSFAKLP